MRRGLVPLETDLYEAALDASWEIDIFGGTRRAVESAEAEIGTAEEARRDVLVSLLDEVGSSYIELRGLQQELAVTQGQYPGPGTDPRPHARAIACRLDSRRSWT